MNQVSQEHIQKLEKVIRGMDIPVNRKHINLNNLTWLSRNLGVRNSNHPKFNEAIELINSAIKNKYYSR